jgi:hypothetical protein
MKTVNEPGIIMRWNGELVKVVSIAEGKTIHMQSLERPFKEFYCLEHSPNFQEGAEPVETLLTNTK